MVEVDLSSTSSFRPRFRKVNWLEVCIFRFLCTIWEIRCIWGRIIIMNTLIVAWKYGNVIFRNYCVTSVDFYFILFYRLKLGTWKLKSRSQKHGASMILTFGFKNLPAKVHVGFNICYNYMSATTRTLKLTSQICWGVTIVLSNSFGRCRKSSKW